MTSMNVNDMDTDALRLAVQELRRYPAEVIRQQAEIDQLRLERDVLALNFGVKDSGVLIIFRGNDVAGIARPTTQAASQRIVKMPSYYNAGVAQSAEQ